MFLKVIAGTSLGVSVLLFSNNTLFNKFDRNLLVPIRDYRAFLSDFNRI